LVVSLSFVLVSKAITAATVVVVIVSLLAVTVLFLHLRNHQSLPPNLISPKPYYLISSYLPKLPISYLFHRFLSISALILIVIVLFIDSILASFSQDLTIIIVFLFIISSILLIQLTLSVYCLLQLISSSTLLIAAIAVMLKSTLYSIPSSLQHYSYL